MKRKRMTGVGIKKKKAPLRELVMRCPGRGKEKGFSARKKGEGKGIGSRSSSAPGSKKRRKGKETRPKSGKKKRKGRKCPADELLPVL